MEKKDYIVMAWIALFVVMLWIAWTAFMGDKGSEVYVICDKMPAYSGSLYKEAYIVIVQGFPYVMESEEAAVEMFNSDENATNLIVVKYGRAEVSTARCPDKICVKSASINKTGQSIVCMPNKVAVSIR